jgi:hypothetical protein
MPGGHAYLRLQALARQSARPTQELLVTYVLERFLRRVASSAYRDRLVLKGGMLLAALGSRRPTADIDLLALAVSNDIPSIAAMVRAVLAVDLGDGVIYQPGRLTSRQIRDADLYTAVRLVVPANVDRARAVLRLDVNVGDPVTPPPEQIEYPELLGGSFQVLGYPLPAVLAEKIVTVIDRGAATTRERDFADAVLLTRRHQIDAEELAAAMRATAAHRGSTLRSLAGLGRELGSARQASWRTYLDRAGLTELLPASYADAIAEVAAFAGPVLGNVHTAGRWNPLKREWETRPSGSSGPGRRLSRRASSGLTGGSARQWDTCGTAISACPGRTAPPQARAFSRPNRSGL